MLLQVVFHARLAEEDAEQPFDIDDVAAGIVAKLVRRHPHVFADGSEETTPDRVEASWDRIKTAEKGRESVLDGIPTALPALARADAVLGRLTRAGLAADHPSDRPADRSATNRRRDWDEDEVGGTLLDVVRRARESGVDAEAALRAAVRRLELSARQSERLSAAEPGGSGR